MNTPLETEGRLGDYIASSEKYEKELQGRTNLAAKKNTGKRSRFGSKVRNRAAKQRNKEQKLSGRKKRPGQECGRQWSYS